MDRVKNLFVFLGFFLLCLGCGPVKDKASSDDSRKKILSTIAQIEELVSEIGGDRVESSVLVRGELNPHSYELVKGDDEKLQRADLLVSNGLGLEHGASVIATIQQHRNALAIGDAIQKKFPDKILWKGAIPDPHIWMDIALWKEGVDPLTERMVALDPEGESYYRNRARVLKEKMQQADVEVNARLRAIPAEKRYLVTSHDAFHYFTRRYLAEEKDWGKRFAAPEGLSPDGQLNPMDLQRIIDHLHEFQIQVIFPESNVSRDSIRKIAIAGKQLGLNIRICQEALYGDSIRGRYLDAMKHNAEVIAKHLEGLNEKGS